MTGETDSMRITRMRAMTASVLGMAMIAISSPAWATSTSSPTASPTVQSTAEATETPEATEPAETPDATEPAETPDVTESADTTETPTPGPVEGTGSPTPTPATTTSPPSETGDPLLDGFLSLLPFKVPLDREIDDISDFDLNPLVLKFTCGAEGPDWKMVNLDGKHSYGFGWFDTSLGGGISEIGPGATLDINSHALAVIAAPWNGETKELLVTVPTVGVSDCEGTPAAAPVAALPVAAPAAAAAVTAEPYYTG
jgi:hypothetical protein